MSSLGPPPATSPFCYLANLSYIFSFWEHELFFRGIFVVVFRLSEAGNSELKMEAPYSLCFLPPPSRSNFTSLIMGHFLFSAERLSSLLKIGFFTIVVLFFYIEVLVTHSLTLWSWRFSGISGRSNSPFSFEMGDFYSFTINYP